MDMLSWLWRFDAAARSFRELFAAMACASFSFCSAVNACQDTHQEVTDAD